MARPLVRTENFKKMGRRINKDFKVPMEIMKFFVFAIFIGSNILYALANNFNTKTFPIDGCNLPYSSKGGKPAAFPYNICPGSTSSLSDVTNPCWAPVKWLGQTLAGSWIAWRKMLLLNPKDDKILKDVNIIENKFNISQKKGLGKLIFLLGSSLIFVALPLMSFISYILTYCASFAANNGILFTLLFTFPIPILLIIVAPLLSLLQTLEVSYVLLLKPLLSGGGWKALMQNIITYAIPPLIVYTLILFMHYDIIALSLGIPITIPIALYYLKIMFWP